MIEATSRKQIEIKQFNENQLNYLTIEQEGSLYPLLYLEANFENCKENLRIVGTQTIDELEIYNTFKSFINSSTMVVGFKNLININNVKDMYIDIYKSKYTLEVEFNDDTKLTFKPKRNPKKYIETIKTFKSLNKKDRTLNETKILD